MQAINITFKGKTYTIPAYKAFEVGEAVEDIATLIDMVRWRSNPNFHKISRCYGVMLRFAGAKASDSDVHSEMMAQIKAVQVNSTVPRAENLFHLQAIQSLMEVLMDGMPEEMRGDTDAESDTDGKKTPAS